MLLRRIINTNINLCQLVRGYRITILQLKRTGLLYVNRTLVRSSTRILYGGLTLGSLTFYVQCAANESPVPVDPKKEKAVIERLDALYRSYLIEQAVMACERYLGLASVQIQWRIARIYCEQAKIHKDKAKRKEYMLTAMKHILQAKQLESPDNPVFAVHKWYAILLNYTAEYEGTKARLVKAPAVKEALEDALKINPLDATTWHILGVWHYSFADLPSYQRTVASMIFAAPPKSTYEEALQLFLKAESLQPGFYMQNLVYIAKCYIALGNKDKAKHYLLETVTQMVISADDGVAFREANELLKSLGVHRNKETNE